MQMSQGSIPIEGAELYYETRGEGAPVLIVQGGINEAGATNQLAAYLAHHHQVITYDRRGISRSRVSESEPEISMSLHADDAALLLTAVTRAPARVVGASIGAVIGLHLAVRHPAQVALLVAHEPPMSHLVVDQEREAQLNKVAALAEDDVRAAIQLFASFTNDGRRTAEDGAQPAPPVGDLDTNLRRFFSFDFPAVRTATLNVRQIAAAATATPIILTGGRASRGGWEYRCAQALALGLGRDLVEMPGGHGGPVSHPFATAGELLRLFGTTADLTS